jgi:hypothetical protein
MRKLKKIVGVFVIAIGLLVACDDFLSPTVEIFNGNITPTEIELRQKQKNSNTKKNSNIKQGVNVQHVE